MCEILWVSQLVLSDAFGFNSGACFPNKTSFRLLNSWRSRGPLFQWYYEGSRFVHMLPNVRFVSNSLNPYPQRLGTRWVLLLLLSVEYALGFGWMFKVGTSNFLNSWFLIIKEEIP